MASESEWKTRKKRIDPKLDAPGWRLHGREGHRSEGEGTADGPAEYTRDTNLVGVVEVKKLTFGPEGRSAWRTGAGSEPSKAVPP